ncbi:MAG: helix-turn-helix domain-containing protein [Acidobacteria bacterium]|nr:helix-turn-helix domain-containing protein [Acidobacteriota bacterium]
MNGDWETLLPLLVHIQANLEADLSLGALGRKAGLSPFHLQRLFRAVVGETPRAYTERLRLERAAFRLLIHESALLEIALDCGFRNHETFARAFRRRFGQAPRSYREWARWRAPEEPGEPAEVTTPYSISATKVIRLRPIHVAFLRHTGPYENVPESLFDDLQSWRSKRGYPGPAVWLGIGHDSPSSTSPEKLRFDAAVEVPAPFASEGRVAHQLLPGGEFAVTTHAGPYETLTQAYPQIFPRLMTLPRHRLIGLPVVEIYHTTRVTVAHRMNHTDICLPVEAK